MTAAGLDTGWPGFAPDVRGAVQRTGAQLPARARLPRPLSSLETTPGYHMADWDQALAGQLQRLVGLHASQVRPLQ